MGGGGGDACGGVASEKQGLGTNVFRVSTNQDARYACRVVDIINLEKRRPSRLIKFIETKTLKHLVIPIAECVDQHRNG